LRKLAHNAVKRGIRPAHILHYILQLRKEVFNLGTLTPYFVC
jgi:hypothetical protein